MYQSKNKYPVFKTEERISFIKELNFVDKVISYKNTDQSNLLKNLNIDIFVIGPEFGYSQEHKSTLKFCSENNIEIITTERTENISTTLIINRILNK